MNKRGCWLLVLVVLGGCGGKEKVYKQETFEVDSPYQMSTLATPGEACESARRALLGQGYVIHSSSVGAVRGKKAFQPSTDQSNVLEMNVVCVEKDRGTSTRIFANAMEITYGLKKSNQSASVGLSAIGSVSLPVRSTTDSMVKTSEVTINDKDFYNRFFTLLENYLDQAADDRPQGGGAPPPKPGD